MTVPASDRPRPFAASRLHVLEEAPAWLDRAERLVVYALVAGLAPARVVEVGARGHGTADIVHAAFEDLGMEGHVALGDTPRGPFELAIVGQAQAHADLLWLLRELAPDARVLVHDAHHADVAAVVRRTLDGAPGLRDCGLVVRQPGSGPRWGGLRLLRWTG